MTDYIIRAFKAERLDKSETMEMRCASVTVFLWMDDNIFTVDATAGGFNDRVSAQHSEGKECKLHLSHYETKVASKGFKPSLLFIDSVIKTNSMCTWTWHAKRCCFGSHKHSVSVQFSLKVERWLVLHTCPWTGVRSSSAVDNLSEMGSPSQVRVSV